MATKAFKKLPRRAQRAAFAKMDDKGNVPRGGRSSALTKGGAIKAVIKMTQQGHSEAAKLFANAAASMSQRPGYKATAKFKKRRRK